MHHPQPPVPAKGHFIDSVHLCHVRPASSALRSGEEGRASKRDPVCISMNGYIPPAKQREVDFPGSHCCFLSPPALLPALCLQRVGVAPRFQGEGLFPQAGGTAGCGSAHLWKLRPSLSGHSDLCSRPASNHLFTKSLLLGPRPKAPGLSPRAPGQDRPRDHQQEEGGLEKGALTRASRVARIRACVLDSQISHLCSEPNCSMGTSCGWKRLLTQDPLTADVGTIPQVAVKGADKPVGSSQVAHHQGRWQLCALRCARGWTAGVGLACIK